MRRKISLYIADTLVDLDDQSFVLFNYTREEQANPAIVKNSFSQSITLPGTPTNNAIFGNMARLDRIVGNGFNPLSKAPFAIFNEANEILESGYVKLNGVTRENSGAIAYNVSLYGGLGGFFYSLMYREDGTKKTLADLYFEDPEHHGDAILPEDIEVRLTAEYVASAWTSLKNSTLSGVDGLLNYAPAYNGFPSCKFSADKAVYKEGASAGARISNLYVSKNTGGIAYGSKTGDSTILLEMGNQHTEWETQDLRAYLQRPILRVKKLLEAFTLAENCGGYSFHLDSSFFNEDNSYTEMAWMTLPMFQRDTINPAQCTLADLLSGTASPAEYLIGYAKMFGLSFAYDAPSKTITLMGRNEYFSRYTPIDLTERIDRATSVNPLPMDAKYYIWQNPSVKGQFASEYASKYGRSYGAQWVNTGYDFSADQKEVLEGIVYNGASDVRESNINYQVFGGQSDPSYGAFVNDALKFAFTESVSWKLYGKDSDNKDVELECAPTSWALSPFLYGAGYADFMPKVQLHGEDNKAEDGENVLLFFNGMVELPTNKVGGITIQSVVFHLSDDTQSMLTLNGGVPCWDVSPSGSNIVRVNELPSFRRWYIMDDAINDTFDFGYPREVATGESYEMQFSIYDQWWKAYVEDIYDVETRIVTRKVDFSGMKVDSDLLRNFYFFDNAIWVLNNITNHSLTTYDLTDCEFIKVGSMSNYTTSQPEF